MGLPGKPAASAPARPGSPAPIASGLLRLTPPNPPRQLPIESPAATPPWAQSLFFRIKRQATSHLRKKESCAYDLFQGIDELETVAVLIAMGRREELPAHLRRAEEHGVTRAELSALITHLAFYAGFPAAITASAIADTTFSQAP